MFAKKVEVEETGFTTYKVRFTFEPDEESDAWDNVDLEEMTVEVKLSFDNIVSRSTVVTVAEDKINKNFPDRIRK